jgi:hypothetical protein
MVSMVIMSAMGWSCSMSIMSMVIMSASTSTDFMELDTIMGVFFFAVESYIGEIIPYREYRCTHDVREEYLIEHEKYTERDDRILTRDHPIIEY